MSETFAEREGRRRKAPSRFPRITREQKVHMPLASMATAARHMRIQAEQTRVGKDSVPAADSDMRIAGNLSKLRTSLDDVSKRLLAMLERVG